MSELSTQHVHPSWRKVLTNSLECVDPHYRDFLTQNTTWLPGAQQIFNAFSLPRDQVNYILFGESPYPRAESANGYAFWDAKVESLWSKSGLSKAVNRATSLRNFIKMLLVAEHYLGLNDTSQAAIAMLNKNQLIQTASDLFQAMMNHGILLLNTSLVLSDKPVRKEAQLWQPFMQQILLHLTTQPKLLLFGKVATHIESMTAANPFEKFTAEHPYNVSFITNETVRSLFAPLRLLSR